MPFGKVAASLFALALSALLPLSAGAALDREILGLVNKTVFEVVVPKPAVDSLSYERPLPLDLLPFTERNDTYRSIGTAFAISPTEFVTAAHVLMLDFASQAREQYLRDGSGNVYPIDRILKYSDWRDFVVFSVKGRAPGPFLPVSTEPELNDKVYAVGNALGEGIVIRDGLYTSNTPENLRGAWKWLRFSAAASPGNSGGPLLNGDGKVLGVVLQKSPSENLNIALPIAQLLQARDGVAEVYRKQRYTLDNTTFSKIETLSREIGLPRSYRELREELTALNENFAAGLQEKLLAEYRPQIFPNGRESLAILNSSVEAVFPRLIMRGADGAWSAQEPREKKELEVGNNGTVSLGMVGNVVLMYIQKPDNIPLATFYGDSKVYMDTLATALGLQRQVGIDKIKITSFGPAKSDTIFSDGYRRKWLVRIWNTEHNDEQLVTFSLPVPGGFVTMMRGGRTGLTAYHLTDLRVLADFIYVTYAGTLKKWREFLDQKALLPEAFSSLEIGFDYGGAFRYRSGRVAFSLDPQLMTIGGNSSLKLYFGYFSEQGKTVWDVKMLGIWEDKNAPTGFHISRNSRPPEEINERHRGDWDKIAGRKIPYNRTSFFRDRTTSIAAVLEPGDPQAKPAVLYTVGHVKEGNLGQQEMSAALERFLDGITLLETP